MKEFLGNRVEDAAMSFINVLKYSDQSVDYPSFENLGVWPDEITDMFKEAAKNNAYSELTAVSSIHNNRLYSMRLPS